MSARNEIGTPANAELVDDGERVAREVLPVVVLDVDRWRIAVAVPAEVEGPHAPARFYEALRNLRPHHAVESGRVREERRRPLAAEVVHRKAQPVALHGVRGNCHSMEATDRSTYPWNRTIRPVRWTAETSEPEGQACGEHLGGR